MVKKQCKQCGKQFTISDSEINFYKSKNLSIPKRCKECRESNKKSNDCYRIPNIDDRLENIVNNIKTPPVLNNKISISDNRKKHIHIVFACCTALIAVVCITAVVFLSQINNKSDCETGSNNVQIQSGNAEITVKNVQTDNGYTEKNDSDDEVPVTLTSDAQPQIAFTEVPGGNDYDDSDAFVYEFRSKSLLENHFQKHGKDMGFESADEYEQAACNVITSPDALHKTEAEDGDNVYYIETTNDFVIVSTDGYIRTYFRPDSGKAYYDKQ